MHLTIIKNGIVQGGSVDYSYDGLSQELTYSGSITVKFAIFEKTEPFSGTYLLDRTTMLSANVRPGETFTINGYSFKCLNVVGAAASFAVSGSIANGTVVCDLSQEYISISALHLDVKTDGISGTILAHN
jgi:hypothetical protein